MLVKVHHSQPYEIFIVEILHVIALGHLGARYAGHFQFRQPVYRRVLREQVGQPSGQVRIVANPVLFRLETDVGQ